MAAIDWQWAGPGCGATDLAYACCCALSDGAVVDYEKCVLRVYHDALVGAAGARQQLPGCSAPHVPSYEQLLCEFKLAMLDWFRWVSCAVLPGVTPASMQTLASSGDINRGQYSKDAGRMAWAWQHAEEFLDELYPD